MGVCFLCILHIVPTFLLFRVVNVFLVNQIAFLVLAHNRNGSVFMEREKKKKVLSSQYVVIPQQTTVIETPAGV